MHSWSSMTLALRITFHTSSKIDMVLITQGEVYLCEGGLHAVGSWNHCSKCFHPKPWMLEPGTHHWAGPAWPEFNRKHSLSVKGTQDSLQKRSARTQELMSSQSRRESWKTRVGWKCLHFLYELEIDTQVQFVQLLYNYDPLFYL